MVTDLFNKPKTMEQRILEFAREKGYFSTIDLENFKDAIKAKEGIVKGLMRVQRTCRQLAEKKVLRRLDSQEKVSRGFAKRYATFCYRGDK